MYPHKTDGQLLQTDVCVYMLPFMLAVAEVVWAEVLGSCGLESHSGLGCIVGLGLEWLL